MTVVNPDDEERMNEIYKITSLLVQTKFNDFKEILSIACGFLNMEAGIISHVNKTNYKVLDFYSVYPDVELKNQSFDLNDTYCEITLRENRVFDIHNVEITKYKEHPCLEKFSIKCYIGVPLWVNSKKYGTLSFTSTTPRATKFKQADRDFVQYLGQWISSHLEKHLFEQQIAEKNQQLQNLNHELELNNENLYKIMQEKDQLSQILLHDLKSPLSNIKMLSYLFEDLVTNKDSEELLSIFNKSMQDVFHLINQMETLNSMENTSIKLYLEDVEILNFIHNLITNFSKTAAEKSIKLRFDSDNVNTIIKTDINLFTRILNNLMSNAIKFSPFNKDVFITVKTDTSCIIISIKDEGPGIFPQEMEKLFKRFSLLSNKPTNNESSSGLGLYIVKELLDKIKGNIKVSSTPGEGSTFSITLPKILEFS